MPRLFTYIIPIDDGAAPNPFRGLCTLAICKPRIRSVAELGDWVAGVGSVNAQSDDLSKRLVYAMKVTEKLSMEDYDAEAPQRWPHRIPNVNSTDLSERLGDCIYDFSSGSPVQRPSVHGPENIPVDLSGRNVLISNHFFYFGSRAIRLPDDLLPICPVTRGHRSTKNQDYFDRFVSWIDSLQLTPGQIYGWPDFIVDWRGGSVCGVCTLRRLDDEADEEC